MSRTALIQAVRMRRGFTLAEMMVAILLFGLVGGALLTLVSKQQRFYRGAGDLIETRSQLRQAASILPTELRGIYPAGGDIIQWSDSSIQIRANTGSSFICVRPAANTIILPPVTLASGGVYSTWITAPQVADSLLIYDEGELVGNSDDTWQGYYVTAVLPVAGGCPAATRFTGAADALAEGLQLTLDRNVSVNSPIGSPIRFFRPTHFRLYQAADKRWYLGAFDCLRGRSPACATTQPVSGPYRPYSETEGESGLSFRYFTEDDAELVPGVHDRRRVARIDVVVRGETQTHLNMEGYQKGQYRDSAAFVVGLRNRN